MRFVHIFIIERQFFEDIYQISLLCEPNISLNRIRFRFTTASTDTIFDPMLSLYIPAAYLACSLAVKCRFFVRILEMCLPERTVSLAV